MMKFRTSVSRFTGEPLSKTGWLWLSTKNDRIPDFDIRDSTFDIGYSKILNKIYLSWDQQNEALKKS